MISWFELIKDFYPKNWNAKKVGDAVLFGKITPDQYKEITGDDYVSVQIPKI
ncbi:XkdX family protein [Bacillus cereus]|uniref:XkdX family protein n=1 Tax=Bacillus cereus TaxID=1396 RepID=UPI000BF4CDFE|nr:XkdX family protein [Bacillus cereus]PFL21654.1 XkdX family protein [Bacillus cereus]